MNLSLKNKLPQSFELLSNENDYGETPLSFAPSLGAIDDKPVVPQQFLDVRRTLQNVENILADIDIPSPFVLFAGEEKGFVYLVCAIVGHENYPKHGGSDQAKIVYGRRWFLEHTTPTSEVVQTALLAVKKAKEHELREKLIVKVLPKHARLKSLSQPFIRTTPFNCHLDAPLMASHAASFVPSAKLLDIEKILPLIEVDGLKPVLKSKVELTGKKVVYEIELAGESNAIGAFPEFVQAVISFICADNTRNEFLHSLFSVLLSVSDQAVDETFRFNSFARFSRKICPMEVGRFSHSTRTVSVTDSREAALFAKEFEEMSYRVDSAKAPLMNRGALGLKQRETLQTIEESCGAITGYLPPDY